MGRTASSCAPALALAPWGAGMGRKATEPVSVSLAGEVSSVTHAESRITQPLLTAAPSAALPPTAAATETA
eukprot:CAMPEP_0178456840 /NCGR_PEP_ID=MMETSP0689_2-20121128/46698_1 /TAXON_ID=160604 /ORGANISM="Amphidinium massartii, Strain CS-259" /LENGTH=70 /DNA_ID=CAMNT_0020083051 /DNA_START=68 /DNA_END=277 /DNA_ORIENTATION=-